MSAFVTLYGTPCIVFHSSIAMPTFNSRYSADSRSLGSLKSIHGTRTSRDTAAVPGFARPYVIALKSPFSVITVRSRCIQTKRGRQIPIPMPRTAGSSRVVEVAVERYKASVAVRALRQAVAPNFELPARAEKDACAWPRLFFTS